MIYPNLAAEVARAGLSYPKLAEAVGINVNTLYYKLKGVREFTLKEMEAIRDYFKKLAEDKGIEIDTSLEYLFYKDLSVK